jgi:hypothetical protein
MACPAGRQLPVILDSAPSSVLEKENRTDHEEARHRRPIMSITEVARCVGLVSTSGKPFGAAAIARMVAAS